MYKIKFKCKKFNELTEMFEKKYIFDINFGFNETEEFVKNIKKPLTKLIRFRYVKKMLV